MRRQRPARRPSGPPPRWAFLAVLAVVTAAAAVRAALGRNDPQDFLLAIGLVALFTPLKALMIRWLGGRRPYSSACVASLFSVILGMAFRERYGLVILLLRSTAITAVLETAPLFAMRTLDRPLRLLGLSAWMSLVVHLLSGGFVLLAGLPLVGIAVMVVGVAAMWAPLFLPRLRGRGAPGPR